jgi:hypothetical protein
LDESLSVVVAVSLMACQKDGLGLAVRVLVEFENDVNCLFSSICDQFNIFGTFFAYPGARRQIAAR